jgi:tetratricopeptide (TPR) repeat protein
MLQFISALNNTAVHFLVDGLHVDKAERSLRQAMQCLSAAEQPPCETPHQESQGNKQPTPIWCSSHQMDSAQSPFACHASDLEDALAPSHDMMDDEDDELGFEVPVLSMELTQVDASMGCVHQALPLYNRALVLSYKAEREEVAAVVLFNLALIHHIRGISLRMSGHLENALKLYELAIKILQRHSGSMEELLVDELLVFAIFFNLGHAQALLFCHAEASTSFDFLRHVLRKCDNTNTGSRGTYALQDDDLYFFFFNTMLVHGELLTLAPAA